MNSEHQHHHHPDEKCECGCHDGHHDHHDHSDHSHQSEQLHHDTLPITVKTHDSSLVGSYRLTIEACFEDAQAILDEALKKIAAEITALGGIIGHIKANLTAAGRSCMISITEAESDSRYTDSRCCQAEGVAIVFGILPEQLDAILNAVLAPYLRS